jgi:beta-galactosidase
LSQDAPIRETGDVDNAKFKALRSVIQKYSAESLPSVPTNNEKAGYGPIHLQKKEFLFDILNRIDYIDLVESENPISMESVGQMFGFLLYVSEYAAKADGSILSIPKVHDRAQVFISCSSEDKGGRPTFVGTIERWSNRMLGLPKTKCVSNISLYVLVENMGRINYGPYMFDRKGILSSVYLDGRVLHRWKMLPFPLNNLNEVPKTNPIIQDAYSELKKKSARRKAKENVSEEPAFYAGHFTIVKENDIKDTFISFSGWGKGIAFVNEFNIGRYWPMMGPQCSLYVPAPVLQQGENVVVVLELESPNPKLVIHSVDQPDFACRSSKLNVRRL